MYSTALGLENKQDHMMIQDLQRWQMAMVLIAPYQTFKM